MRMGFLYIREESDTRTVIRYTRYVPAFVLLIVSYALAWFVLRSAIGVTLIAGFAMFAIFRDQRTVRRLVMDGRKEGTVTRSGRSWSIANPLTFTIERARRPAQRGPHKGTQRSRKKRR